MLRGQQTELDVAQEKRIDHCWNVDEDGRLSDSWTGFTKFTLLKTPPKGYMWSGRRRPKIQTTTRPDHVWPWSVVQDWDSRSKKRKTRIGNRETETRHCTNSRGNYSTDPDDEEYKDIIKNARRKLERHVAAAMPCKRKPRVHELKGNRSVDSYKSQCIWKDSKNKNWIAWWKLMNPQDQEWNLLRRKIMKTTLQAKDKIQCRSTICAKTYSNASGNENSRCGKASVDKEWKKLETIPAWQLEKVKNKKEVKKKAQKNWKISPLCFIDGHLSSAECGVGTTIPDVQRTCCASRRYCEGWLYKAHLRRKWRPHK